MPVPGPAFGHHCTGDHIQNCKQGDVAEAAVVVGDALRVLQLHVEQRLRLLVNVQYESVLVLIVM